MTIMSDVPLIDVCGKRITEYVIQSISKFNRGAPAVMVRGVGINSYKAMQVVRILKKHFDVNVSSIELEEVEVNDATLPSLNILIEHSPSFSNSSYLEDVIKNILKTRYHDFYLYSILFDHILNKYGRIEIKAKDKPLFNIEKDLWGLKVDTKGNNMDFLTGIYHRSGILPPKNWKEMVEEIYRYDDVIIGVDTNIFYHAGLTEHLFPILTIMDRWNYVYTPNWMLIVIPNAVMHEIEQSANISKKGYLGHAGRIGYRALAEIIEIDRAIDIPGVSIIITGKYNPVLDNRIEIKQLRKEIRKNFGKIDEEMEEEFKISSGDTIIRDQFKEFVHKIDFHKGVYFLTADKANRALAEAEGLDSIYYAPPYIKIGKIYSEYVINLNGYKIRYGVPIGKLIFESAVEKGEIEVEWNENNIVAKSDNMIKSLDNWIDKKLEFDDISKLINDYEGDISLDKIMFLQNIPGLRGE